MTDPFGEHHRFDPFPNNGDDSLNPGGRNGFIVDYPIPVPLPPK